MTKGDRVATGQSKMTTRDSAGEPVGRYRWIGWWLLPVTALLLANADTLVRLLAIWRTSADQNHAPLIVAVVGYLLWRQRALLAAARRACGWPNWAAAVVLLVLLVIWRGAVLVNVQLVEYLAFFTAWPLLAAALWGWRVVAEARFAVFYLLLMVFPFADFITPQLQEVSTHAAAALLRLTGVPLFTEYNLLQIPGGDFAVEPGCSGSRFLVAALAIGLLYAHLYLRTTWARVVAVASLLLLALLGNWLRIYGIIMLGYVTSMDNPWIEDHWLLGWVLFGCLSAIWFWVCGRWLPHADDQAVRDNQRPASIGETGAAKTRPGWALLVTLVVCLPVLAGYRLMQQPDDWREVSLDFPSPVAGWRQQVLALDDIAPQLPGVARQAAVGWRQDNAEVVMYLGVFQHQDQGAELVSDTNLPYDPARWRPLGRRVFHLPGGDLSVREYWLISPRGGHRLVWSWYDFGDRQASDRYLGKLLELRARIRQGNGVAIWALAADGDDFAGLRQRLGRFVEQAYPALHTPLARQLAP